MNYIKVGLLVGIADLYSVKTPFLEVKTKLMYSCTSFSTCFPEFRHRLVTLGTSLGVLWPVTGAPGPDIQGTKQVSTGDRSTLRKSVDAFEGRSQRGKCLISFALGTSCANNTVTWCDSRGTLRPDTSCSESRGTGIQKSK